MGSVDYRVFVVTLLVLVFSCVFQIIGLVTPGWFVLTETYQERSVYVGTGLWKVYMCTGGECRFMPILGNSGLIKQDNTRYAAAKEGYLEQQIETVVALILLGFAIVVAIARCCSCDSEKHPIKLRVTGGLALVSGLFALFAVFRMTAGIIQAKSVLDTVLKNMGVQFKFEFPYSLLLTGIGGLLACVTGIGAIVKTRRQAIPSHFSEVNYQQVGMEPMCSTDKEKLMSDFD